MGHTLKGGLSSLFDGIVRATDTASMAPILDSIVRMRAVQDFTASQAVAFIFLLKPIIRAELMSEIARFPNELAALEARIDEAALLAFDLFMKCREQIYAIRANEAKRMTRFQRERARSIQPNQSNEAW